MTRIQIYKNNLKQVNNFFHSERYGSLFENDKEIEDLLDKIFNLKEIKEQTEWNETFQNYIKLRDAFLHDGDITQKQNYENAVIALEEKFQERMSVIRQYLDSQLQKGSSSNDVTPTNRLVYLLIQKQKGQITAQFQKAEDILKQDAKNSERQFLLRSSNVIKAQKAENELKGQTLKTEKFLHFDSSLDLGEDVIDGISRVVSNFYNGTNIVMSDGTKLGMNSEFSNQFGNKSKITEARMIDILFSGTRLELFRRELQKSEYNGISQDEKIQKAQEVIINHIQKEYDRDLQTFTSRDGVLQQWSSENVMGILQGDAYNYMTDKYSNEVQIKTQGFGQKNSRSIDFVKTNGLETAYLLFSNPEILKGFLVGGIKDQELVFQQLTGIITNQVIENANIEGTEENRDLMTQVQQLFIDMFGSTE